MNGLLNASTDTVFASLSPKLSAESGDASASQTSPTHLGDGENIDLHSLTIPQNAFANLLEEITPPVQETGKTTPNQQAPTQPILLAEANVQNIPFIMDEIAARVPEQGNQQETIKYAGIKPSPETVRYAGIKPSPETIRYAGIKPSPETVRYAGIKPSPETIRYAGIKPAPSAEIVTDALAVKALQDTSSSSRPDEIKINHGQLSIPANHKGREHLGAIEGKSSPAIKSSSPIPETSAAPILASESVKIPLPVFINNEVTNSKSANNEIPQQPALKQTIASPITHNSRLTPQYFAPSYAPPIQGDVHVRGDISEQSIKVKTSLDRIIGGENNVTTGNISSPLEIGQTEIKPIANRPLVTSDPILVANSPLNAIQLSTQIASITPQTGKIQQSDKQGDTLKSHVILSEQPPLPAFYPANLQDGQHKYSVPHQARQPQNPAAQFTPVHAGDVSNFTLGTTTEVPQISLEAKAVEIATTTASSISGAKSIAPPPALTSHIAVQQVGDALVRQIEKSGDIVIRLDPAELGKVNITFTFDKAGGVNAQVVADTASTAAVLRDRSDILTAQLKQSGFENINLSFDANSNEQNNKGFGTQLSNQNQAEQNSNRTKFFDIVEQDSHTPVANQDQSQKRPSLAGGALDMKL